MAPFLFPSSNYPKTTLFKLALRVVSDFWEVSLRQVQKCPQLIATCAKGYGSSEPVRLHSISENSGIF